MRNLDIFIYTHKPFECKLTNESYKILTCSKDEFPNVKVPVIRDYTGDNISDKNLMYNEYTGIYWLWKNYKLNDYVGINHYRRYYAFMDNVPDVSKYFEFFDIILNKPLELLHPITKKMVDNRTYYSFWHNVEDFDLLEQMVREKYPEYVGGFEKMKASKEIHNSSIFIMGKDLFNEYCSFIFDALDTYNEYHGHHTVDEYRQHVLDNKAKYIKPGLDYYTVDIQTRIVGYIAERLLNTFLHAGANPLVKRSCTLENNFLY